MHGNAFRIHHDLLTIICNPFASDREYVEWQTNLSWIYSDFWNAVISLHRWILLETKSDQQRIGVLDGVLLLLGPNIIVLGSKKNHDASLQMVGILADTVCAYYLGQRWIFLVIQEPGFLDYFFILVQLYSNQGVSCRNIGQEQLRVTHSCGARQTIRIWPNQTWLH